MERPLKNQILQRPRKNEILPDASDLVNHQLSLMPLKVVIGEEEGVIHRVTVEWWREKVKMDLRMIVTGSEEMWNTVVDLDSTKSVSQDQARVKSITEMPAFISVPTELVSMDLLFWNVKGARNNVLRATLKNMVRQHNPEVLILLETEVSLSSMGTFFHRLGYYASSHIDCQEKTWGIWIVWDPTRVSVCAFDIESQVIHAWIQKESYEEWVLAAVYGSKIPGCRYALWSSIKNIADSIGIDGWNDEFLADKKCNCESDCSRVLIGKPNASLDQCSGMELQCSWPKLSGSRMRFPGAANYCDHLPVIVCREGPLNMNSDGCTRGNPGNGGFGGVVRDSNGFWMFGYVGNLEEVMNDEAQLWGVYRGLTILLERNVRKVVIETHSTTVVNWLRDGGDETCVHNDMVHDCRYMLSSLDCSIQHTARNTNQCADWLANFGSEQHSLLVVLEDYPREIGSMLVAEMVARTRE